MAAKNSNKLTLKTYTSTRNNTFTLVTLLGLSISGVISAGGRGTPYNGLYGEAPPERGTFFRLRVYKRVGISQFEVYKR